MRIMFKLLIIKVFNVSVDENGTSVLLTHATGISNTVVSLAKKISGEAASILHPFKNQYHPQITLGCILSSTPTYNLEPDKM